MILGSWGLKSSRKSAGGLTTLVLKGQTIAKQKRAKGQSNPSPQYLQSQAAARLIVGIFQKVKSAINAGFTSMKPTESPYNAFYSYTYLNALDLSSPPAATLEPADLLVSKGLMTPTIESAATTAVASTGVITVHHATTEADATQLATDQSIIVAYNNTQDKWFAGIAAGLRSSATATITAPTGFMIATDSITVYFGMYGVAPAANAGTSSNSVNSTVTAS